MTLRAGSCAPDPRSGMALRRPLTTPDWAPAALPDDRRCGLDAGVPP